MKNVIKILTLTIIFIFVFVLTPSFALAWDDCPKDKVNDSYPGDCARYIDTDGNGICDHSEPAPEDRIESSGENAEEEVEGSAASARISDSQKDDLFPNYFAAIAITAISLAVIVGYVTYRNLKTKKP